MPQPPYILVSLHNSTTSIFVPVIALNSKTMNIFFALTSHQPPYQTLGHTYGLLTSSISISEGWAFPWTVTETAGY